MNVRRYEKGGEGVKLELYLLARKKNGVLGDYIAVWRGWLYESGTLVVTFFYIFHK